MESGSLEQILGKGALQEGWRSYEQGEYEHALTIFSEALEQAGPVKKEVFYGLGLSYWNSGDTIKAVKNLIEAIKLDRFYHEAFIALGDVYLAHRQIPQAIENYGQAVGICPENTSYIQKFVDAVGCMQAKKVNPNLKALLTDCLENDAVDFTHMGHAWLSIIESDPALKPFYKLSMHKDYAVFKKALDKAPNLDALIDPFFLIGLGKFIVPDVSFERWFTFLRRYILNAVAEEKTGLFSEADDVELITCAFFKYCVLTDHVFFVSEEERQKLEILKDRIHGEGDKPALSDIACFGCYQPLYMLDNARNIAANLAGGDHISQIPKSYIEEYFQQQAYKKKITSLTLVEDSVSKKVREQYEDFPYPRWLTVRTDNYNHVIEGSLKGTQANILIAGCGTGKEAAQMAYVFPDSKILAVDLSLNSLAYAQWRTQSLGLENIEFCQADINEMAQKAYQFDYIASAGVLHHLEDPIAGWRVLNDMLKPGGLMRIALYSRHARWAINQARAVIAEKDISDDAESIRGFRQNIDTHLKYKAIQNIATFYDYYSLPECRDLLFHVQEHQFDLIEIESILKQLNLDFLQFHLAQSEIEKYKRRYKDDPQARNLNNWAQWEEKHKDIFSSMYTFWCQKPK